MALLEVTGASVQFGGLTAVNEVSFRAEPGEVRALIGPNGAGKTTLFKAIAGEEPLSAGDPSVSRARRSTPSPRTRSRPEGSAGRSRTAACSAS